MKLPERLARRTGRGFHSAFATTFAVEFAAFEEVMLPQFVASGASNVLLVADARMTTMALSDGSAPPSQLGRDYALFSPPSRNGVFHPKVTLQLGRDCGRCFISSANTTGAGLGGNVEIAVEIECDAEASPEREIVRAAWRYIDALVPMEASAARDALNWANERAQWLNGAADESLQQLEDGSAMAILASPDREGIGQRFVSMLAGASVERLVIVSPYWDKDLAAVAALEDALTPSRTSIMLDVLQHEFPSATVMPARREIIDISDWRPSRFTHAKLVIAITAEHDHVLSGSANCTVAALGNATFCGINAEACLYRRLPRGTVTAALDLDRWLEQQPIDTDEIPVREAVASIPLDQLQALSAGSFETEGGRLHWRRPLARWTEGTVVLSDEAGEIIEQIDIARFVADGDHLTTWVGELALKPASFALVRGPATESLRTFVNHRTALRTRRRESVGGAVARALSIFNDGSELHLWVHQAFDELSRADVESEGGTPVPRAVVRTGASSETAPDIQHLTYEEFMSARAARRGRGGRSDSALAGTHCDSVRALLNRLSGGTQEAPAKTPATDDDSWMDLGDESGELPETVQIVELTAQHDEPAERPAPDLAAYERHIRAYAQALTAGENPIGARDVLRLRLWIMLLLQEAQCPSFPRGMRASSDVHGWPRLLIRILSSFFWGKRSALSRLVVSNDYDDMPEDFLECWATVLWALDAIIAAVPPQPRNRDFLRRLPMLRSHVVLALGLQVGDLDGDVMTKRRRGLAAEFGTRFGIKSLESDLQITSN